MGVGGRGGVVSVCVCFGVFVCVFFYWVTHFCMGGGAVGLGLRIGVSGCRCVCVCVSKLLHILMRVHTRCTRKKKPGASPTRFIPCGTCHTSHVTSHVTCHRERFVQMGHVCVCEGQGTRHKKQRHATKPTITPNPKPQTPNPKPQPNIPTRAIQDAYIAGIEVHEISSASSQLSPPFLNYSIRLPIGRQQSQGDQNSKP